MFQLTQDNKAIKFYLLKGEAVEFYQVTLIKQSDNQLSGATTPE